MLARLTTRSLTVGCADLQESEYIQKPEVKIVIPDVLKLQLVDDWENVTKNNQVSQVMISLVSESTDNDTHDYRKGEYELTFSS